MKRALILAGVLVVLAAVGAVVPAVKRLGGAGAAGDVPTYEVRRGDFVRRIHADGNLKAVEATLLGPPPEVTNPLKIAWLAPDGSPVAQGEVVVRFDPTEMEESLRDGMHDRAAADSRIEQREVRDEGSRHNLDLDSELALLELDYAQNFQSKDAQIFSRTEIIESEIDEDLARTKKDHADVAGSVHHELAQTELDLLAIERRKAELTIQQARDGLQKLEVRAPHTGIFVLKTMWGRRPEVGQMVWGGQAVAEIPRLEKMEAQVYVLEADAGGLEVGLPATVALDADPGRTFAAKVLKVTALAQRRNRQVPIQYFGVTLELERTDVEVMKPGHRVQAVITLDERADVLTVPRQAVFEEDGRKIVYVRRGGGFEPREVHLGPAGLGRMVVEDGIEPGDRIALRDPTKPAEDPAQDDAERESAPVAS
jgi:RND family efflux transporter MFP subunit